MKFGEKVRDLRKKNSLTQDELAKCLGVSKRTIIGWERDGRYPRNVEILEKMADIFHSILFAATNELGCNASAPLLAIPVQTGRCQVLDNIFHK